MLWAVPGAFPGRKILKTANLATQWLSSYENSGDGKPPRLKTEVIRPNDEAVLKTVDAKVS